MYNHLKQVAKKFCDMLCFILNSTAYLRKKIDIEHNTIQKILLINLQGIGDIVMTTPFISALKEKWPTAKIDYLCYKNNGELLEGDSRIHIVLKRNKEGITSNDFIQTLKNIRKQKYDLVINLFPAQHSALLTILSNAEYKLGNLYSNASTSNNLNVPNMPKTWDIRENAKHIAMQLELEEYDETNLSLEIIEKAIIKNVIAINPFATWKAKNWPQEHWIELIQKILKIWKETVIILGGPEDISQSKTLEKIIDNKRIINQTGKLTLKQTAVMLKSCKLFITTDSGLMHIAIATQTKTIALFGVTNPEILVNNANNIKVCSSYNQCPKKYQFNHNNEPEDYTQECMKKITTDEVVSAVKKALK
ncbi:MAG: glycosyltransferase family 9 protein [Candidatus Woesearchaeota archaeon]|jgi:ADP-heptose:LPS heptosyltransferase